MMNPIKWITGVTSGIGEIQKLSPAAIGRPRLRRAAGLVLLWLAVLALMVQAAGAGATTVLVSDNHDPNGEQGWDGNSDFASINYEGDIVAFSSLGKGLLWPVEDFPNKGRFNVFFWNSQSSTNQQVTVGDGGNSHAPYISHVTNAGMKDGADGRFITFESTSPLLPDISNGSNQIYLFDRDLPTNRSNSTSLVSVSAADPNKPANADSGAFAYPSKFPFSLQVTVHAGAVVYAQYKPTDLHTTPGNPARPMVIFESNATNLLNWIVPPTHQHIYLRDVYGIPDPDPQQPPILAPSTHLVSRSDRPGTDEDQQAPGDSLEPAVSQEGRFVAFVSNASPNTMIDSGIRISPPNVTQVYLVDRDADGNGIFDEYATLGGVKNYLVSISRNCSGGGTSCDAGNKNSWSPSVVYIDNRNKPLAPVHPDEAFVRVSFHSFADNLVDLDNQSPDTNNAADAFVYDLEFKAPTGSLQPHEALPPQVWRVSLNGLGEEGNGNSFNPVLTDNGGLVSFTSYADNLVADDANHNCTLNDVLSNCPDIFMRDIKDISLDESQIWRVSLTAFGEEAQKGSGLPAANGSGRFLAFTSQANLLDKGQAIKQQIFLRDQGKNPGNPIIDPQFGDFYAWVGQPVEVKFKLTFLDDLTLGNNGLGHAQAYIDVRKEGDPDPNQFFQITSDSCSPTDPNVPLLHEKGSNCFVTVVFTPSTDRKEKRGRLIIPLLQDEDGRPYLQVGLRGSTIVRYLPLLGMP